RRPPRRPGGGLCEVGDPDHRQLGGPGDCARGAGQHPRRETQVGRRKREAEPRLPGASSKRLSARLPSGRWMRMRRYIRANTAAATCFFTVTLQDRGMRTLVDHVVDLRTAFAQVKQRHPFAIDAMVVLPEHLHAIWTLPEGDADFGKRWM